MFLFKDKQGNWCAAKTIFSVTWGAIINQMLTVDPFDYAGASAFLASVGAVYFGRTYSKDHPDDK